MTATIDEGRMEQLILVERGEEVGEAVEETKTFHLSSLAPRPMPHLRLITQQTENFQPLQGFWGETYANFSPLRVAPEWRKTSERMNALADDSSPRQLFLIYIPLVGCYTEILVESQKRKEQT